MKEDDNIINLRSALRSVQDKEVKQRKTIKRLHLENKELKLSLQSESKEVDKKNLTENRIIEDLMDRGLIFGIPPDNDGMIKLEDVVRYVYNLSNPQNNNTEQLPKPIEAYDKAQQLSKGKYIDWYLEQNNTEQEGEKKHSLIPKLDVFAIGTLKTISDYTKRLTSGNVSHQSRVIEGIANRAVEFINNHLLLTPKSDKSAEEIKICKCKNRTVDESNIDRLYCSNCDEPIEISLDFLNSTDKTAEEWLKDEFGKDRSSLIFEMSDLANLLKEYANQHSTQSITELIEKYEEKKEELLDRVRYGVSKQERISLDADIVAYMGMIADLKKLNL